MWCTYMCSLSGSATPLELSSFSSGARHSSNSRCCAKMKSNSLSNCCCSSFTRSTALFKPTICSVHEQYIIQFLFLRYHWISTPDKHLQLIQYVWKFLPQTYYRIAEGTKFTPLPIYRAARIRKQCVSTAVTACSCDSNSHSKTCFLV